MGKRTNTAVWLEKYKRWQIKVQKDGQRRTFTSSTPGRAGQREANAKADGWLDCGVEGDIRAAALYSSYVDNLRLKTSPDNYEKIERDGKNHILPLIGHLRMSKLSEEHLQNIIDHAAAKGLAKKTLRNILSALSGFLKYARKRKFTTLTTDDIEIPKSAPVGERTILQPEDLITLFTSDLTTWRKKLTHDPLINAYRLQALTGLRPGELLGLEWEDVHGRALHIKRSVNKEGRITRGKNQNAVRTVALCDLAVQVIENQRSRSANLSGRIFDISSQQVYWSRWNRYKACNCLSDVTPYELRHTFVSVVKCLPEGQVKGLVGHSKNMDTFGTYGHALNGELEQTAQSLTQIFEKLLTNYHVG